MILHYLDWELMKVSPKKTNMELSKKLKINWLIGLKIIHTEV